MAYTIGALAARTSAATNPITVAHTINAGETVLVLMMKVVGATDRTGGAPTYGGRAMVQASTTQKAASTPECSAELWYLTNPKVGAGTLVIPNAGSLTIFYERAAAKAPLGYGSVVNAVVGANATSVNPTATLQLTEPNTIIFSIVATGAQTWAPSARTGTLIADSDDGATGTGSQYLITNTIGAQVMGWTFATNEDYGTVAAAFSQQPSLNMQNFMSGSVVGSGASVSERTPFH